MTTATKLTKEDKIAILVDSIKYEDMGRYSVESLTLSGWRYLVHPRTATTPARCQCEHSKYNPGVRCIHMAAIRAFILSVKF